MKLRDVFSLAFKNFGSFVSHSVLMLLALTLLSSAILFLGNLGYFFRESFKSTILYETAEFGTEVSLTVDKEVRPEKDAALRTEEITNFLGLCRDQGIMQEYSFYARDKSVEFQDLEGERFDGFAANAEIRDGNPEILSGRQWTEDDESGDGIWLSSSSASALSAVTGDRVTVFSGEKAVSLEVIGITDSKKSFVAYKYLTVDRVIVCGEPADLKFSDIRKIAGIEKKLAKGTALEGNTISDYGYFKVITGVVGGVCAFLALLCVLASIGSILNTLRIVAGGSADKLCRLKTLGMRDGRLFLYVFTNRIYLGGSRFVIDRPRRARFGVDGGLANAVAVRGFGHKQLRCFSQNRLPRGFADIGFCRAFGGDTVRLGQSIEKIYKRCAPGVKKR